MIYIFQSIYKQRKHWISRWLCLLIWSNFYFVNIRVISRWYQRMFYMLWWKNVWASSKNFKKVFSTTCPAINLGVWFPLAFSSKSPFSLETSPLPWKGCNFDLYSALMIIEQLGFFSVPHLLWQMSSVCNGHLWGPVTLAPVAKRLAGEVLLLVVTT